MHATKPFDSFLCGVRRGIHTGMKKKLMLQYLCQVHDCAKDKYFSFPLYIVSTKSFGSMSIPFVAKRRNTQRSITGTQKFILWNTQTKQGSLQGWTESAGSVTFRTWLTLDLDVYEYNRIRDRLSVINASSIARASYHTFPT